MVQNEELRGEEELGSFGDVPFLTAREVVTVGACTSACEASWRTALALPFDMNIVALNAVSRPGKMDERLLSFLLTCSSLLVLLFWRSGP